MMNCGKLSPASGRTCVRTTRLSFGASNESNCAARRAPRSFPSSTRSDKATWPSIAESTDNTCTSGNTYLIE